MGSVPMQWPIGVSKKSCRLCWLLKDLLNQEQPAPSFVLPGTHGTYHPWVPPPGLPDRVLIQIREDLLEACEKAVLTHSRQSSAASSGGDQEYPATRIKFS